MYQYIYIYICMCVCENHTHTYIECDEWAVCAEYCKYDWSEHMNAQAHTLSPISLLLH